MSAPASTGPGVLLGAALVALVLAAVAVVIVVQLLVDTVAT
jgi:hypothetical protein